MTPSSNAQQTGSSWDPDRNTGLNFGPPDQAERSRSNAGRTPYTLRGWNYRINNGQHLRSVMDKLSSGQRSPQCQIEQKWLDGYRSQAPGKTARRRRHVVGDEDLQATFAAELDQLDGDLLLATGQEEYLEQRERCFTGWELDAERDPGRWPVRPPYGTRRCTNASRATKAGERANPSILQAARLPREDLSEKASKAENAQEKASEERERDESDHVSMTKQ
ncbi:hypothetical protein LTR27_010601 [Elasticomyces elasticus]|nr:hypothetical protein LTR27_010601 [Elasticomyces elasticus]